MLKLIAWDDKPNEYMQRLLSTFEDDGFIVEFFQDPDDFLDRLEKKDYDFIISDNLFEDHPKEGASTQLIDQILRVRSIDKPLIIITREPEKLIDKMFDLNVIVKSKTLLKSVMKSEIKKFLIDRGLYVDRKKVFLIFGHDKGASGFTPLIRNRLIAWGLSVEQISSDNIVDELASGLVGKMNNCGAFIAVCTPDNLIISNNNKEQYAPRMNVILEIGIALGLSHGVNRLAIIQRWGADINKQAELPSDLGGYLSIRCKDENVENFDFEILKEKLKKIGLEIP